MAPTTDRAVVKWFTDLSVARRGRDATVSMEIDLGRFDLKADVSHEPLGFSRLIADEGLISQSQHVDAHVSPVRDKARDGGNVVRGVLGSEASIEAVR